MLNKSTVQLSILCHTQAVEYFGKKEETAHDISFFFWDNYFQLDSSTIMNSHLWVCFHWEWPCASIFADAYQVETKTFKTKIL